MPFSSGGRTRGVLPDRRLRAHVATEEGAERTELGRCCIKGACLVGRREGGGWGTAACVGAGCLIVLHSCVLAPAIGGSRVGASFGEESRECGGRVTEVGGR